MEAGGGNPTFEFLNSIFNCRRARDEAKLTKRMLQDDRGATVDVLYVLCRHAKTVKVSLEKEGLLDKQYRMTRPSGADASLQDTSSCIAIPVTKECLEKEGDWSPMILSMGRQYCLYSSSVMGNNKNKQTTSNLSSELSTIQKALLTSLIQCSPQENSLKLESEIVQRIKGLSLMTCPKKLEVIGDDQTLVIPRRSFRKEHDQDFVSLCSLALGNEFCDWGKFWKCFATFLSSPRVVRRGDIDPDSSIRESGHRLLWPYEGQPEETGTKHSTFTRIAIRIPQTHYMIRFSYRTRNTWVDYGYGTRYSAIL